MGSLSAADAVPVAEFRAALRGFLRTSETGTASAADSEPMEGS